MIDHNYPPIGIIHTVFKEKFGVPRQSGMVEEARAILKLNKHSDYKQALNHLEDFSHLWIIFVFHKHSQMKWKPIIHPPREDAPRDIGVFASRSPHRPNPIGMSAVKLEKINWDGQDGIEIHLSGVDFLDQTPVLDIKPYLPYTDIISEAQGGWAEKEIVKYSVTYSDESLEVINSIKNSRQPNIEKLLTEIMQWDPRPTSQKLSHPIKENANDGLSYAFHFLEFDVHWKIKDGGLYVFKLEKFI